MSDSQREHSAAIEHLVPSLQSLRQKICSYMSEGHFWMIYFTILLPRFNESDRAYLSTPEIVELRETLMSKLQSDKNTVVDSPENSEADISIEEDVQDGKEGQELLIEEIIAADTPGVPREADGVNSDKPEQWVEGEGGLEELSFSDLEDVDTDLSDGQARLRSGLQGAASALSERLEWIQLDERSAAHSSDHQKASQSMLPGKDSEGEDSNGWDHVDDADIESLMSA
ncbi:hypothetical protein Leryth_019057 [Lithospermum erythrorhizon]|nr:hypothetical protein Leryth_019057 [Lithospermum erythrorhizon]